MKDSILLVLGVGVVGALIGIGATVLGLALGLMPWGNGAVALAVLFLAAYGMAGEIERIEK